MAFERRKFLAGLLGLAATPIVRPITRWMGWGSPLASDPAQSFNYMIQSKTADEYMMFRFLAANDAELEG